VSAGLAVLTQQRVLLVDCDPRGHASLALGVESAHVRYSVTDLLMGARPDVQALCWEKGTNLHILPAHATLTDVERNLGRCGDSRLRLHQALHPLRDAFDVMVIDTPPTLGFWTQAPLVASTDLLIPVDMGSFAVAGMHQLLDALARLRQEVPLTLTTPHILLTKVDARTTLAAHVRALLRERGDAEVLHTVIRVNIALARAQRARQSIFAYDRTSRGAHDYQHVVEELLGKSRAVEASDTVLSFRPQRRGPGGRQGFCRKLPETGKFGLASHWFSNTRFSDFASKRQVCDRAEKIARLKWSLWHGNLYKARYKIDDLESLIDNFEETYSKFKQLRKAVEEFRTYIINNGHLIPNYSERYRNGEAIATGFVESTVNQVVSKRFCKRQQMQWSKRGAHLLLQTRVKTLNRELGSVFKHWYPDMEVEEIPDAA
jgi:cellulose biosynthesis protein BcsQ